MSPPLAYVNVLTFAAAVSAHPRIAELLKRDQCCGYGHTGVPHCIPAHNSKKREIEGSEDEEREVSEKVRVHKPLPTTPTFRLICKKRLKQACISLPFDGIDDTAHTTRMFDVVHAVLNSKYQ